METVEKKTKSLTLKTRTVVQESTDEGSEDCSESEDINLLTRKFQKFIKMKNKLKNQQGKRGKIILIMVQLNLCALAMENKDI